MAPELGEVLGRHAPGPLAPDAVWNVVTDRPPTEGIKDYDLFYFDESDLSFGHLPAAVEIRNEARVHLWYEDHFGVPCAPYTSTEAAIDSFAATTCCLGIRLDRDGRWRIYAPHGLADVFNLVVRPNPVLAPRSVYETKTQRWREHWPELTVLPWPETGKQQPPSTPAD